MLNNLFDVFKLNVKLKTKVFNTCLQKSKVIKSENPIVFNNYLSINMENSTFKIFLFLGNVYSNKCLLLIQ